MARIPMKRSVFRMSIFLTATTFLAACEGGPNFDFLKSKNSSPEGEIVLAEDGQTQLIEREVEAPDVFSVNEDGLWDGRPSLGGVWVAYPDVKDPERVLIRNEANNKTVVGALFRRERDNPGPKIQVSSDAAEALGLLAGQPNTLSIVALRTESVPVATEAPISEIPEGTETLPETAEVTESSLGDPIATAAAAIEESEALAPATVEAPLPTPVAATPAPARKTSSLSKPFIQIGIFSEKGNADNTATSLRGIGIVPTVKEGSSQGKRFWRVIVGPASSSNERGALLGKVKDLGFNDAYFVSN